jgi:flagellar hook-length control protein FliK
MEQMSTIPAPVEAMIFGHGSFFGSCQMAANNFEPFFQSAVAGNETNAVQGVVTGEQSPEFRALAGAGKGLRTFSEVLEGYGENKVLEHLQKILGKEAGTEAFELVCMVAQNGDVLGQLNMEEQRDIWSLFKIMDMTETPFSVPKESLENWVEKVKNIFGDAKIEFKQPEELLPETEEEPQTEDTSKKKDFVAMSYEDLENMRLLVAEMGIKPEDVPKFETLINSLLENGLLTSQDLNNAIAAMSYEDFKNMAFLVAETETKSEDASKIEAAFIIECIEDIWKLVKNDNETEIKNLVNKADNLIDEEVVDSAKEITSGSAREVTSDSAKEETTSGSVKESVSDSAGEMAVGLLMTSGLLKRTDAVSAKEFASNLAKDIDEKNIGGGGGLPELEKIDLVRMYLELLKKKKESLEDDEKGEKELAAEKGEEADSEAKDKITLEDSDKEKKPPEEEDSKLLDFLLDPKKAEKIKRKDFRLEMQHASQTQQPQQVAQTQPQQARQIPQIQPEVRAVWEVDGLKIEVINPKTGEKLQTSHETIPQRMQERINEFEVVRQIVAQAKFITTPTGEQKMTIQLRPEHLGQVDLRINLNHGEMQIHARVESVTAQSALETHIGLLREGLEKQGITLERLEVSVEQRDKQDAYSLAERQEHREQKHNNHRHHRGREQHLAVSIAKNENSDTGRRLGYNTMEYLA